MNFNRLKNFMNYLLRNMSPGNSAVVYLGNKKVFEYSSGYSNLEEKIPMNGNEYLYIYSCSKLATVTAALQLFEQGAFLMNDPLYNYIPEFKEMTVSCNGITEKAKNPIRIQNLFNMTAGFNYDLNSPSILKAKQETNSNADTMSVVRAIADEPLSFEPGAHWQYSLCHDVLAGLVETISGKRFSDYVKDNIFTPLGMNNSFYHTNDKILNRMAEQYQFVSHTNYESDISKAQICTQTENGHYFINVGKTNCHVLGKNYDSGGAGIISTTNDYALLCAALANYGCGLNGERILSKHTVNLLRENTLNEALLKDFSWENLKGYGYGYGVRTLIDKVAGGSNGSLGEFGWSGAAGSTVIIDPEYNLAVFYAQHLISSSLEYYQPRLRNIIYSCLDR